jgi:hypothetical protein
VNVQSENKAEASGLASFDYSEPAELFGGSNWSGRRTSIAYRRFETAAEAIRFAIEELDDSARRSCVLEVNERRFKQAELRKLYESNRYPLKRPAGKEVNAT